MAQRAKGSAATAGAVRFWRGLPPGGPVPLGHDLRLLVGALLVGTGCCDDERRSGEIVEAGDWSTLLVPDCRLPLPFRW